MTIISFFAEGLPKGQPRPRAFAFHGKVRVYDPGTAEGWKSCVALAAKSHLPEMPLEGPLELGCCFYVSRPKKHFLRGVLRSTAPVYIHQKPDLDNLTKSVMDALTIVGMWQDDSQIAILHAGKRYCDPSQASGCQVTVKCICNDQALRPYKTNDTAP